jgi:hypothetical protein
MSGKVAARGKDIGYLAYGSEVVFLIDLVNEVRVVEWVKWSKKSYSSASIDSKSEGKIIQC